MFLQPSPRASGASYFPLISIAFCSLLTVVFTTGCESKKIESEPETEVQYDTPDHLTLLIVGDTALGPRIARQWSARRDGELTLINQSLAEFESSEFAIPDGVDVLVYSPTLIGELVSRKLIVQVPNELLNSDEFNKQELLRHFRTSVIRQSDDSWALPLGGPIFSMMYHRAAFATLKPVETWDQIERTLEKVAKTEVVSSSDQLEPAVDMPLAKGWAVQTLLARVAPAICYRGRLSTVLDRSNMQPLINETPFVEALDQLKAIATKRSLELDPKSVYDLAVTGQSVLAIGWPISEEAADASGDDIESTDLIRIESLPGLSLWYDQSSSAWSQRGNDEDPRVDLIGFSGLVASVSTKSDSERWSWKFLQWLTDKSISRLVMAESPLLGPFRSSHLGDAAAWTGNRISVDVADEYADVVDATHTRALIMIVPRIPGYNQYLNTLDEAVRDAIANDRDSKTTLDAVAKKWDEITESLGRQKQIRALRKESGF